VKRRSTSTQPATEFRRFVDALIERYGSAAAIAEELEMSRSAFTRGVKNEGTLSEDNLLKLAEVVGEPPGNVLRLAGKKEFAERVERLYGDAHKPLASVDRRLLALDHDLKVLLLALVERAAKAARK
jgi:plasmid maintenance system antidote protein VapI